MNVKYLPKDDIEFATTQLLVAYGRKYGDVAAPPIPVEEILECHLELSLGFDDMQKLLGERGVLGATWIDDKEVVIDEDLEPRGNPSKEGRYRFTVAHEVGHWDLHRHQVAVASGAPLLNGKPRPSIVCRSHSQKDPMEWQADQFAGYLLMPENMVYDAWKELTGSWKPMAVADEITELKQRFGDGAVTNAEISKQMAKKFNVSGQAMQIRLTDLGLVLTKKQPKSLFE